MKIIKGNLHCKWRDYVLRKSLLFLGKYLMLLKKLNCLINERKGVNVNVVVDEEESDLREDVVDDSCEIRSKRDVVFVRLSNLCILENLDEKLVHSDPEQRKQMEALIFKYRDLFPDVPRRTDVVFHDVDVIHARPIKQHPYRVNVENVNWLRRR